MNAAVKLEYEAALADCQATEREYGADAVISIRREGQVSRDSYQSVSGHTDPAYEVLSQNVASIEYQPTKYKMEKANLREECQALVYVAMQDLIDHGLKFGDLDVKRMTVTIGAIDRETNGMRYEVTEKSRSGQIGNGFLYLTLGLKRG
jgi:hypothetical protein